MSNSEFNFSDSQSINSEQHYEDPPPKNKKSLAYPAKSSGYYNCRMCKTCHKNQPKLTLQEINIIRMKATLNTNPRPKRCTKQCDYYQKIIERKNYKLYQNKITQSKEEIQESKTTFNNSESRPN